VPLCEVIGLWLLPQIFNRKLVVKICLFTNAHMSVLVYNKQLLYTPVYNAHFSPQYLPKEIQVRFINGNSYRQETKGVFLT